MNVITIRPDLGVVDGTTVRLRCSCGWQEKSYSGRPADNLAARHLRARHDEGRVEYDS